MSRFKQSRLRSTFYTLIAAFLFLNASASISFSSIPQLLSYQGRLTTPDGLPVPDGDYQLHFRIYNVSSGGSALWYSNAQTVSVTNGLYSYLLGSSVPFPNGLFTGNRWLGITVGTDPELTPRIQLLSSAFAFTSQNADSVSWSGIKSLPAGFADGVDNNSGGDITAVNTSGGLTGGATSGDANLSIASGGVTSSHIQNGTIVDADISASAAISLSKIAGGIPTLTGSQTFSGTNTFNNTVIFGDSTARFDNSTVALGRITAAPSALLSARRNYANTFFNYGLYSWLQNTSTGQLTALYGLSRASTPGSGGTAIGTYSRAESDGSPRYGLQAHSRTLTPGLISGATYGVLSNAFWGTDVFGIYASADSGAYAYGVRGAATANSSGYGVYGAAYNSVTYGYGIYGAAFNSGWTNYAGYFNGDVNVTGNILMPAKFTEIDHPLDPENKVLRLAGVDSPELKVIYDGIVTTDAGGEATVTMPDYFDALNTEFRYQLTVIGEFAQAIVARKIENGQFTIRTEKPNLEVSWQVTGVRKDPYAAASSVQVEALKLEAERGHYLQPAAYGRSADRGVDAVRHKGAKEPEITQTVTPDSE